MLRGDGPELPLTLRLDETPGGAALAMLCDRALIQASVGEDNALSCRARYFVNSIGRDAVDVEFPVPVVDCQLKVVLADQVLGDQVVNWEQVQAAGV